MNSFKDIAYPILKEAEKPLHSKRIIKQSKQKLNSDKRKITPRGGKLNWVIEYNDAHCWINIKSRGKFQRGRIQARVREAQRARRERSLWITALISASASLFSAIVLGWLY